MWFRYPYSQIYLLYILVVIGRGYSVSCKLSIMSLRSTNLDKHFQYLPGWLYRAILSEQVPCQILPPRVAIGLCWYEVSTEPRIVDRGDRFCSSCANLALRYYPCGTVAKYVDTKVRDRERAFSLGLSRDDHYCAVCRATLYAIRDATTEVYANLDDYLKDVRAPNVSRVVHQQELDYDSGIEV